MQNTEKKEEIREVGKAGEIRAEIARVQELGSEAFGKGDMTEVARLQKIVISLKADLARATMPETVRNIVDLQEIVESMDKKELMRYINFQPKQEVTVFSGNYENGKVRIDLKFSIFQSSKK